MTKWDFLTAELATLEREGSLAIPAPWRAPRVPG